MGIALNGIGGFDTKSIVDQLMQLERRAGLPLVNKQAVVKNRITAYQDINSKISSLTQAAWSVIGKESKTDTDLDASAVWAAVKGSSSNEKVKVDVKAGAAVGNVEFDVKSLAKPKQVVVSQESVYSMVTDEHSDGVISILNGDKLVTIDLFKGAKDDAFEKAWKDARDPNGTHEAKPELLRQMAEKLNSVKELGFSATVVRVGNGVDNEGEYVLQLTGSEVGKDKGDFEIYQGDASYKAGYGASDVKQDASSGVTTYSFDDAKVLHEKLGQNAAGMEAETKVVQSASDAVISMYGEDITFSSNVIELMDKVSIDLSGVVEETKADGSPLYADALAKGVKVSVGADGGVAEAKVKSMIDQTNEVLNSLAAGMKAVEVKKTDESGNPYTVMDAGPLSNSMGRQLKDNLSVLFAEGVRVTDSQGKSQTYALQDFGIDLKVSKGSNELSVSFDASKFGEAMKADPARAEQVVSALAQKIGDYGSRMSDSTDGVVSNTIKSEQAEYDYIDTRVSDFNDRLIAKDASMRKQYSHLETVLAQYNQKFAQIQGQLAQLAGMGKLQ